MFPTISNQILGNTFTLSLNTSNIPTGSKLTLTTTFGNIYPSSITTTGTLTSTNVYITSASGNISISASVNGSVVGTSNTFSVSSPTSCLQEYSLQGLCVPSSPSTPDPKSLSPGTYTSPGPELSSISQTFSWSPVSGASKYAFYLRDLDSDTLVISNENLTSPTYTYNYLGSGKRYRWNTVAFTSTSTTGWYADPVYFTVKAGLTQPARTIASLTQDELSLCDGSFSCEGMTFQVVGVEDSNTSLQDIISTLISMGEGAEDEAFVDFGGIVIGVLVVTTAKTVAAGIETIASKYLTPKAAALISAKLIPGVGWVFVGIAGAYIAVNTVDIAGKCIAYPPVNSIDPDFSFSKPNSYFCGRMAMRSVFIAATATYVKISSVKAVRYVEVKNLSKTISDTKLQSAYTQHADDWGLLQATWNLANGSAFKLKLLEHINNGNVMVMNGTYRGNIPTIYYFDPNTQLWVGINAATKDLISAWKLSPDQVQYLLTVGNIQ